MRFKLNKLKEIFLLFGQIKLVSKQTLFMGGLNVQTIQANMKKDNMCLKYIEGQR